MAFTIFPRTVAYGWTSLLVGGALITVLAISPIPVGKSESNLAHAVSLALALIFGVRAAATALVPGLLLGGLVRYLWDRDPTGRWPSAGRGWRAWGASSSQQLFALVVGMGAYRLAGGQAVVTAAAAPQFVPSTVLLAAFLAAFLMTSWAMQAATQASWPDRSEVVTFLVIGAVLPVPYAMLTASSFVILREPALLILGGASAVIAPIVRGLTLTDRDLKRKVRELTMLGQVSRALPASLNLETLLSSIFEQVEELLKIDNFYVALYDRRDETLTYPLAIKKGRRQEWPTRPLSDRLTDRVTLRGEPILITHDAPRALRDMGMPELDNPPEAWLGVPLMDQERVIGCLAVFHTRQGQTLSKEDLDLLQTIAGQAALGIKNALLYEETRTRAQALATLNQIATSVSATLDPDRAMESVCEALIQVSGGSGAAIYLHNETKGQLILSHAVGLSESFVERNLVIGLDQAERTQAFQTHQPTVRANPERDLTDRAALGSLADEGVASYADLPMITPSGTIGQASIFFKSSKDFSHDQMEVLNTLVAQAALAVANARAHAATDQALRRQVEQLSRIESIGREMASTLEADELFQKILGHALVATESSIGYLAIHDPHFGGLKVVASQGFGREEGDTSASAIIPVDRGPAGQAFTTGRASNISDLSPTAKESAWCVDGAKSLLSVPVFRWGHHIGVITVESLDTEAFSSEHERFMEQLASHAAVALTNASLYEQLEDHLLEQSLLYQASIQIATTLEVGSVAMAVADSLSVALAADGATMSRWNPQDAMLEVLAAVDEGRPVPNSRPKLLTRELAPALINAVEQSTPLQLSAQTSTSEEDTRYLKDIRRAESLLAIPLTIGATANGLIEVFYRHPVSYDDNQIRTAQTIASQAAIALQNTDLFRKIRESQEQLLAVLNSTREAMLMLDEVGHVVIANRQLEQWTGFSVSELAGKSLEDPGMPLAAKLGYRHGDIARMAQALENTAESSNEVTTLDFPGTPRRTLERIDSPVRDSSGRLIGWLVALRDISREQELAETREQLTEMIVHDLRSPLTTILGSLRLLERDLTDRHRSDVSDQALTVSRRSVNQMLGLVDSLLDIARLESGELPLTLEDFDLQNLLLELTSAYVHEANEQGIILNVAQSSRPMLIRADREKLRRVIANLVDNALKFTPSGGSIEVRADHNDGRAILTVIDNGPGIPADLREHIFERFAQVPGVAGRRRGTGLGLAFARLAVEAHGGKIWVEEAPNGGSLFRFELPTDGPDSD